MQDTATMSRDAEAPVEPGADGAVCLVGGTRIVRQGVACLLERHGIEVTGLCADEKELAEHLERGGCDVLILLCSGGAFRTFHEIQELLAESGPDLPLLVLSESVSRGQVYTALRIGAKAYVPMDAEPEELVRGIRTARTNKVYLAPEVAQLLVDDVAASGEPAGAGHPPSGELSRREIEIVQLLCEGLSSKEIARRLHIAAKTVENHRYNIYRKCEVDSIAALMRHAIHHGMISV